MSAEDSDEWDGDFQSGPLKGVLAATASATVPSGDDDWDASFDAVAPQDPPTLVVRRARSIRFH